MNVRIYKPCKNAMQSGRGNIAHWILEYERDGTRKTEPLMGWTSSGDTLNQVRLKFQSCDEAIAYAQKKGWCYDVAAEHERRVKPKNYSDNFK